jgi:hypothetical protein
MPAENAAGSGDTGANENARTTSTTDTTSGETTTGHGSHGANFTAGGSRSEPREAGDSVSGKPSSDSLMDKLGIPEDIQQQIKPKPETGDRKPDSGDDAEGENTQRSTSNAEPSTEEDAADSPSRTGDSAATEDQTDGEQLPEEEVQPQQGRKLTKEQKRINRLVRQRNEAERAADATAAENQQFREYFARQQQEQGAQQQSEMPAGATSVLDRVATEPQLNTEIARAKALREWCDANAEGVTIGEGENQKFTPPEQVAKWAREADKIIADAPLRLDQIRAVTQARQVYNQTAFQICPELFDRSKPEHQLASALLQELPRTIHQHPGINLFLADWVRGYQARQAETGNRIADTGKNGNGNGQQQKRAIDDRAFAPRIPLAPHTDITTSRGNAEPSSRKTVDKAMKNLIESGGDDEAFKAVLRAKREHVQSQQQDRNPRSAVTV